MYLGNFGLLYFIQFFYLASFKMSVDPNDVLDLFNAEKYEEALRLAEPGLKEAQVDPMLSKYAAYTYNRLAQSKTDQNEKRKCLEAGKKLFEMSWKADSSDENIDILPEYADCLRSLGELDSALQFILECEKRCFVNPPPEYAPPKIDILHGIGNVYQAKGDWVQAVTKFHEAVTLPDSQEYAYLKDLLLNKALCHMNIGKEAEVKFAVADLEKIMTQPSLMQDKDPQPFIQLSKAYQKLHQPDKALSVLESACKMLDKDEKLFIEKGNLLRTIQKYPEAEAAYKRAGELNPKNIDVKIELATLLQRQEKYDKAIPAFQEILKINPQHTTALNNLAACYMNSHKLTEAAAEFEKALKIDPDQTEAIINLGGLYYKLGKYDQALDTLKKAIKPGQPVNAHLMNNLGVAYKMKKEYKLAEEHYEKAIMADKNLILAWVNKAEVEQLLGQQPEALVSLRQAEALLKLDEVRGTLTSEQHKFIESSVQKIIQLQEAFGAEAEKIEKQMAELAGADQGVLTDAQKKYKEIIEQRKEIERKQFERIQKNQPMTTADEQQENEILKQFKAQMAFLQQTLSEKTKELEQMKLKQAEQAKNTDNLQNQVNEQKRIMKEAGFYDLASIKKWFKDNRDTEKAKYCKAFYWTLLNYFDAYRAASTGVLQTNVDHTLDQKVDMGVKVAQKALSIGASLAESIPLVGSIFSVIDSAISAVYEKYKEKKFEDRVNSINKIIMENHSADSQEDLSQVITKAAQIIADNKEAEIKELIRQAALPKQEGTFTRALNYLMAKVDQIKALALGKKIELYDSIAGAEALKDVILVLGSLQKDYEKVIELSKTKSLDDQIVEMIITREYLNLLKETKVPEKDVPIDGSTWKIEPNPEVEKVLAENKGPAPQQPPPPQSQQQSQPQPQPQSQAQPQPQPQTQPQHQPPPQTHQQQQSQQQQQTQQQQQPQQGQQPKPPQQQQASAQPQAEPQQRQNQAPPQARPAETQGPPPQQQQQNQQQQQQQQPNNQKDQKQVEETRESSCCVLM